MKTRTRTPPQPKVTPSSSDVDDEELGDFEERSDDVLVQEQIETEKNSTIKYRTCSWQKTAALLLSEYICLAIMSFPYSYAVLGIVPGLILTFVIAGLVLYTSMIAWRFCLAHPEIRDVCDLGRELFWQKNWAYYGTAVLFIMNNTFVQGFHCLVGAQYLNTMMSGSTCTVTLSAIMATTSFVFSLPRTFSTLSRLASLAALSTFVSVVMATAFAGIEPYPAGYPTNGEPVLRLFPAPGTSFVAGMNAFMNISYTFIGQITIPSFIAEMREPRDFPKALYLVTAAELLVFCAVGALMCAFTGSNYATAPAFGSLADPKFKKIAFSLMVPTLVFLGVLYASVSARFVFFRLFGPSSPHRRHHTPKGWAAWAAVLAGTWVAAFVIAELVPFFSDLLALMSSLFDSFFGFVFWAAAYVQLRREKYGEGFWRERGIRGYVGIVFNMGLVGVGGVFLIGGTYASVQSIIDGYRQNGFGGAFTCASNGL
ncbi:neutral amino acid permease [Lineolata rhizophorae]|uniref:Neutral amino acid permease n=1 Tax=Lineolata rhizophorae TaxID=578093 RepID=A0A6A6NL36_9PEZI|nr:neutral amino acid permease [Lineolata rhizophorae]